MYKKPSSKKYQPNKGLSSLNQAISITNPPSYNLYKPTNPLDNINIIEWATSRSIAPKQYFLYENYMVQLEYLGIGTTLWELSILKTAYLNENIPSELKATSLHQSYFDDRLYAQEAFLFACSNVKLYANGNTAQLPNSYLHQISLTSVKIAIQSNQTNTIQKSNIICPLCSNIMKLRVGKFGDFYGCINYPDCNGLCDLNGIPNKKTAMLMKSKIVKKEILKKEEVGQCKAAFNDDIDDRLDGISFNNDL